MENLDHLGIHELSQGQLEAVSPHFVKAKLLSAQEKSWEVFQTIRENLREGMTEGTARKKAIEIFSDFGVKKHWHQPYIRFGRGTALTFNDPLQLENPLLYGSGVSMDLGPIWPDDEINLGFEGDVGDSFAFGVHEEFEKCASTCRQLFQEVRSEWRTRRWTGQEIYQFLNTRAQSLGYVLAPKVEGHRIGDFPHHKYSRENLANLKFHPNVTLWVLEVQVNDPDSRFGAFFEDIL